MHPECERSLCSMVSYATVDHQAKLSTDTKGSFPEICAMSR